MVLIQDILLIKFFSSSTASAISVVCSILGLILSVLLVFLTMNIKSKVYFLDETKRFNDNREKYQNKLKGYRDSIIKDHILTLGIISDITEEVYRFDGFGRVNSILDKFHVRKILTHLKKDTSKINKTKLAKQLSYIIIRYDSNKGGLL
ncbi:hypothetical protein D5E69_14355 [Rossellomorea marisflavi]|uniref:hypothetical protein n=1 Tax=Rossellomorea marisflavi TaxID=189381 RepID=UPI001315F5A7|nr:hypothetical protein [Rossellomorea marisflavi]QHA36881.1 hypothetical protein D5E69_14355 [Rossellomorea marisflavi]